MEERHIYLLAQFDAAANQKLSDIYQELALAGFKGQQTPDIPYHFTLARFDVEYKDQVLTHAEKVCGEFGAFDVNLGNLGLFGLRVLFAAPVMNYELLRLHDVIVPDEPATGIHTWTAHATILIDEPEAIQRALPIVAKSFSPIHAKVESIGVYEFFPAVCLGNFRLRS